MTGDLLLEGSGDVLNQEAALDELHEGLVRLLQERLKECLKLLIRIQPDFRKFIQAVQALLSVDLADPDQRLQRIRSEVDQRHLRLKRFHLSSSCCRHFTSAYKNPP